MLYVRISFTWGPFRSPHKIPSFGHLLCSIIRINLDHYKSAVVVDSAARVNSFSWKKWILDLLGSVGFAPDPPLRALEHCSPQVASVLIQWWTLWVCLCLHSWYYCAWNTPPSHQSLFRAFHLNFSCLPDTAPTSEYAVCGWTLASLQQ